MLWINHRLNLLQRYVSHVFIYFWTTAMALNSRQRWRLVVLAGELAVIAGASRADSCFTISSLTLPSPVPEVFVPLFITVTSHWGQKGDIATNAAVRISWQLTDWWPHRCLPRWNKLPELQEKKYLTCTWEEVGGLLSCLYPEMPPAASGGERGGRRECSFEICYPGAKWMGETWNTKWIFS